METKSRKFECSIFIIFLLFLERVECFSNDTDYQDNFEDRLFIDDKSVIISKNHTGKMFLRAKTISQDAQWMFFLGSFAATNAILFLMSRIFYEIPNFVPRSVKKWRRKQRRRRRKHLALHPRREEIQEETKSKDESDAKEEEEEEAAKSSAGSGNLSEKSVKSEQNDK